MYLQVGAEISRGERFYAGGARNKGKGAWATFMELGGDVGVSHNWQTGVAHWSAEITERKSGGHAHGGGATETPAFTGDSKIYAFDFVWKWAPEGNFSQQNVTFQFEYFLRDEDGNVAMLVDGSAGETSRYQGEQQGWYGQAVYQFMPQWRIGARYDRLGSNNTGADAEVLAEAGLDNEEHTRSGLVSCWIISTVSLVKFDCSSIGMNHTNKLIIYQAATVKQDVHRIQARPCLIAKMRRADLLVCSGAGLEAGWLPLLIRRAANSRIQHGKVGHFMAAESVTRLDVPKVLDRSLGDIHAAGNPHVHLDPYRVLEIAILLSHRLQRIDPANSAFYQEKLLSFSQQWKDAIIQWEEKARDWSVLPLLRTIKIGDIYWIG